MATEIPTDPSRGWRLPAGSPSLPEVHGSIAVPHTAGFWRKMLAFAGPGLSRGRRLHGSGQLGNRPRRRRTLRLHPPQRHHDFEPDGDSAAGTVRAAGHRQRPRSRAGVPRQLFAADDDRVVDSVRDRDRGLRSGRGDRRRHRAEPALRAAAHLGRLPHVARRADRALPAAQGLPLRRGARHRADRRSSPAASRVELLARTSGLGRGRGRIHSAHRDLTQPGHALHRHRHSRRDGDAAQPLPALVDRADAEVSGHRREQGGSDPVRDDRLVVRADVGAVHQRRDSGDVGGASSTAAGTKQWPISATPTSCCRRSSASRPRACCSRWRCSARARTRRSPGRWPDRS